MIQFEQDCAYNPTLIKIWQDLTEKQRLQAFHAHRAAMGCDFVHK
jgi:hypothetical protein